MAVTPTTAAKRIDTARVVRLAELAALPLSNNLVALITWRTGLDLYPVLAAALYNYVLARHLRTLGAQFRWRWRSVGFAVGGCARAARRNCFLARLGSGRVSNTSGWDVGRGRMCERKWAMGQLPRPISAARVPRLARTPAESWDALE